jgi:hypothetical protein
LLFKFPTDHLDQFNAFARPKEMCLSQINPHRNATPRNMSSPPEPSALEDRLRRALQTVAQLVVGDPAFLPVFERLERELAKLQSQSAAIERAKRYLPVAHQNAMR